MYTLQPTETPPVLFYARRKPQGVTITALAMTGTGPPQPVETVPPVSTAAIPGWCETDSWIGAFFIEGIGPTPAQPVMLEYRGETSRHQLIVEPGRHTVRAEPGFVIMDDSLSDSGLLQRSMIVEMSRGSDAAFPLIVHVSGRWVTSSATSRSFAKRPVRIDHLPDSEWRVYFLSAIPGSEPWSAEGPPCD